MENILDMLHLGGENSRTPDRNTVPLYSCVSKNLHHENSSRNINRGKILFPFALSTVPCTYQGLESNEMIPPQERERKWKDHKKSLFLKAMNCSHLVLLQNLAQLWTQRKHSWRWWDWDPTLHITSLFSFWLSDPQHHISMWSSVFLLSSIWKHNLARFSK